MTRDTDTDESKLRERIDQLEAVVRDMASDRVTRRTFLGFASGAATTALLTNTAAADIDPSDHDFTGDFGHLLGPSSERPDASGDNRLMYWDEDTGDVHYTTWDNDIWQYVVRQPVTETYTGDGTITGREITVGFEPRWFEVHRDDSDNAEVYEGVGAGGDHSMRTVGGALTTDISRSTSVYTTSNGVMVGDGDATHANTNGVGFVVIAMP